MDTGKLSKSESRYARLYGFEAGMEERRTAPYLHRAYRLIEAPAAG
ncbi:hypothetical protein I6F21_26525 [Bradyrhizobium sp. NBAIM03]|nr:hypothetical protein [Bradyrhizobium sp. NBAIM03]MCA1536095.1 hypothetical protein [Bradyrhizobium sp. NBAIM03]